jgi:hypothetical protein
MFIDQRPLLEATQSTVFDPVLRALSACPHLQLVTIVTKFASADAIRNLLRLPAHTVLRLALPLDHWLTVANEIRLGRCLVKKLHLILLQSSSSEATKAVKAVASAIRESSHLESLVLQMEDGFTDEAGVALAEAVTINKTLRVLSLDDSSFASDHVHTKASLSARAYEACCAMLRVNTSITVDLPVFDAALVDQRLVDACKQMLIELQLNNVGRGRLLASNQTPREAWVNVLQELNARNDDALLEYGCLNSLLRLNPSVCLLELNDTTNSVL